MEQRVGVKREIERDKDEQRGRERSAFPQVKVWKTRNDAVVLKTNKGTINPGGALHFHISGFH